MKEMVKPSRLAAACDIDEHTLYGWMRQGRIPFVRVGERAVPEGDDEVSH